MPRSLIASLLISIAAMSQQTAAPANPDNPQFSRLAEQFMHESLALSPVNASQAGYHQHRDPKTGHTIQLDSELDDLSPQAFARQAAFYRDWRARFRREIPRNSLSLEDQADWRLIYGRPNRLQPARARTNPELQAPADHLR